MLVRLIIITMDFSLRHSAYESKYKFTFINTDVKSVHIRSNSGPHFPAFRLNAERYYSVISPNAGNADQNNSENGHFLRSATAENMELHKIALFSLFI